MEEGSRCDDVWKTDDVETLIGIMEQHDIPEAGANTAEEMRERVILHLEDFTIENKSNMKKFAEFKSQHEERRTELSELYKLASKYLHNNLLLLSNLMQVEGTARNLKEELETNLSSLIKEECTVLVAGETGAGKSTLLNLLLGETILPQHSKSCTSTICKIRYGSSRRARIRNRNSSEEFQFSPVDDASHKIINDAIFKQNNREEGTNVKEVEIFLPAEILKSGLVIVDTPGIGENQAMEEILEKFVEENTIHGFIYVIKSDNAGGVQEDRVIKLLNMVLNKHKVGKKGNSETCLTDPSATIFVCNRWDTIQEERRDEVSENAARKLGGCWPNLNTSQIHYMSAMPALSHLENGYLTKSYVKFMDGLESLVNNGLSMITKRSHSWLKYVLTRCIHHVKTLHSQASNSETEYGKKFERAEKKLGRLESKSGQVFDDFQKEVDKFTNQLTMHLNSYLKGNSSRMACWSKEEVQKLMFWDKDLRGIENMADTLVTDRIVSLLLEWKDEKIDFDLEQKNFLAKIRGKLYLLEDELEMIESDLQEVNSIDLDSNHSSETSWYDDYRRGSISCIPISSSDFQVVPPPLIPFKTMTRLLSSAIRVMKEKKQIGKICKDTGRFLRERGSEALRVFLSERRERDFVESQTAHLKTYINGVRKSIPRLVNSNKQLMEEIRLNQGKCKDAEQTYGQILQGLLFLQEKVMAFGFHKKYSGLIDTEIVDLANRPSLRRGSIVDSKVVKEIRRTYLPQGIFYRTIYAQMEDKEITIREHWPFVKIPNVYTEAVKLESLKHKSVCVFLGIMERPETHLPNFVYGERLFSLRSKTKRAMDREIRETCIREIASGLQYLHMKGLVHMELSLDTIMINWHNEIKLSGACLPRKAGLYEDSEEELTNNHVYLSPEVLAGGRYAAPADLYALGLAAYELYTGKCALKEERGWKLREFRRKGNALNTIRNDEYASLVPKKLFQCMLICLSQNPAGRMTAGQVTKILASDMEVTRL